MLNLVDRFLRPIFKWLFYIYVVYRVNNKNTVRMSFNGKMGIARV